HHLFLRQDDQPRRKVHDRYGKRLSTAAAGPRKMEISRARLRPAFSFRRRRRALLGFPLHLLSAVPSSSVLERAQSDDLEKLPTALAVRKGRLGAAKYRDHCDGQGDA